jgi:hypothetical protein
MLRRGAYLYFWAVISLLIKRCSSNTAAGEPPGVPIAELDLDALEL